mgnify:CR=1 FL=1
MTNHSPEQISPDQHLSRTSSSLQQTPSVSSAHSSMLSRPGFADNESASDNSCNMITDQRESSEWFSSQPLNLPNLEVNVWPDTSLSDKPILSPKKINHPILSPHLRSLCPRKPRPIHGHRPRVRSRSGVTPGAPRLPHLPRSTHGQNDLHQIPYRKPCLVPPRIRPRKTVVVILSLLHSRVRRRVVNRSSRHPVQ